MNSTLTQIIRNRRSIFPAVYNDVPITKSELDIILENARWAPNHKKTEPWRFVIYHSKEALIDLAKYCSDAYKQSTAVDKYSENKYLKISKNIVRSGAVIAIAYEKSGLVPEWEEIAAVSMAVQNMWLSCTDMQIGCYWSTPGYALNAGSYLGLNENTQCLGFFFLGRYDQISLQSSRENITNKVKWR